MLTPNELQHWGLAICVTLLFVSCGVAAMVNVIDEARHLPDCSKVEP